MSDEILSNLEFDGRLDELEKRVSSDLGDGRGNGNIWRQLKELSAEDAKLKETLVEALRKTKESNERQQTSISTLESTIERGKGTITTLEEVNQNQAKLITELFDITEKQQRNIDALIDRLNGKGLVQVDPYEKVVSQVRQLVEQLQGGEGQLSFPQVRNSIQQTQFLGRVLYGAIGLFGVGAVTTAGFTLIGGENVSPEVRSLQHRVTALKADIDKLDQAWRDDIKRQLDHKDKDK